MDLKVPGFSYRSASSCFTKWIIFGECCFSYISHCVFFYIFCRLVTRSQSIWINSKPAASSSFYFNLIPSDRGLNRFLPWEKKGNPSTLRVNQKYKSVQEVRSGSKMVEEEKKCLEEKEREREKPAKEEEKRKWAQGAKIQFPM